MHDGKFFQVPLNGHTPTPPVHGAEWMKPDLWFTHGLTCKTFGAEVHGFARPTRDRTTQRQVNHNGWIHRKHFHRSVPIQRLVWIGRSSHWCVSAFCLTNSLLPWWRKTQTAEGGKRGGEKRREKKTQQQRRRRRRSALIIINRNHNHHPIKKADDGAERDNGFLGTNDAY